MWGGMRVEYAQAAGQLSRLAGLPGRVGYDGAIDGPGGRRNGPNTLRPGSYPTMTEILRLLRWLLPALALCGGAVVRAGDALSPEDLAFFEGKVRPVLSKHCYKCHAQDAEKIKGGLLLDRKAGWLRGGDTGRIIEPGDPDGSLLVKMIGHDPDLEPMPPKSKLAPEQIADLREWVKRGAPDPRLEEIGEDVFESDFDLEDRKSWWSLQPVAEVAVPKVKDAGWPANDYDRFILAELEEKGWKPAQPAGKERLLRRVTLALTGLAPTEEELAGFLSDASPEAYEKVVDRLMASPHFGERWARHWMDVVRFAESKAFEQDYTMPFVDRYRDYLIRAFNEDLPYDQFVKEAFAGDLLAEPRVGMASGLNESAAGPGFLYLTDGQHGPPDLHGDEARVFDGIIGVSSVAFQGVTLACARCHDHKFDAITSADYYSFYGMLRSSRLHYANVANPEKKETAAGRLESAKKELMSAVFAEVEEGAKRLPAVLEAVQAVRSVEGYVKWRKALQVPLKRGQNDEKQIAAFRKSAAAAVGSAASERKVDAEAVMNWLLSMSRKGVSPELGVMRELLEGKPVERLAEKAKRVESAGKDQAFGLSAESLGEWIASGPGFRPVKADGFVPSMTGAGVIRAGIGTGAAAGLFSGRVDGVLRSPDFVLDGGKVELWARGQHAAVQLIVRNYEMAGYGPTTARLRVEINSDQWKRIGFDTRLWKGQPAYLEVQHNGTAMKCIKINAGPASPSDDAWVAVAAGELPPWGRVWVDGLNGESDPVRQIPRVIGKLARLARQGKLDPAGTEVLGALMVSELVCAEGRNESVVSERLAHYRKLAAEIPEPVYVRSVAEGEGQDQPVYIRGDHKNPSAEPNARHFFDGLGGVELASPGSGRLEWAGMVADPNNPLTARVRVNRIWSRLFGRGLVGSVDDFGKMGELPSHPELLDFLARDFVEGGWSTKAVIRKMVRTSTFRMDSAPGSGVMEEDPKNLLLQHMPVMRMDGEAIRDHILACSGELKPDLYGPSVPANIDDQPASRAKPRSGPLDGKGRRSIYVELRRNYLPSFLRVFDMPNATEPAGKRNVTNVPAQSLALMNDRFVHEQARAWARRTLKEEASDDERLRRIHRRAFSREATEVDLEWGHRVLEELSKDGSPEDAWADLCHLMINRKEFIYVF